MNCRNCGLVIPDEIALNLSRGPVQCVCGHWLPSVDWPRWAHLVALWRQSDDTGVGDTFHRLAVGVGADRVSRLVAWFGIDCGCDGRRELWNDLYPYDAV